MFVVARIGDLLTRRRTISFEFFPPRSDAGRLSLGHAIGELEAVRPDFVSVTYGAAGSDRTRTAEVTDWIARDTDLVPMPHLTCRGHTRTDVAQLLLEYRRHGIENLLALGGDPPADGAAAPSDYTYALDLLEDIAATDCFSIGVAAHPEVHPRSTSRADDRRHLAEKLGLADFAMTQFFFDVAHYVRLVEELAELGVDKPVIPGVMPFVNIPALRRMSEMNGTEIPRWLADRLDRCDGPDQVRRLGAEVAIQLSNELLDAGAPGLHIYTLNRAATAKHICQALDFAAH